MLECQTEKSQLIGCLIAKWVFSAWLQQIPFDKNAFAHQQCIKEIPHSYNDINRSLLHHKTHKTFYFTRKTNAFRSNATLKSNQLKEREVNLCWLIVGEEIPKMLLWRMCGVKGIFKQQREPHLALRCRYIKLIGRPFKRNRPIHNKKLRMYLYISLCEPICNFLKKKKLLFFIQVLTWHGRRGWMRGWCIDCRNHKITCQTFQNDEILFPYF